MLAELSAAATSLKLATDIAKGVKASIDALNDAEMKFKFAELYSTLAEAKIALADAESKVSEKDQEIDRLKRQYQRVEADTVVEGPHRFRKHADGKPLGRPFCPRCSEVDARLILLEKLDAAGGVFCPECKRSYRNFPNHGER